MKTKHALIVFVTGVCLTFIGSLFKLQHWEGASQILMVATVIEVAGIVLIAYKVITNPKAKDFFNN